MTRLLLALALTGLPVWGRAVSEGCPDITTLDALEFDVEYQFGSAGFRGIIKQDHVWVTHVAPGSPAEEKLLPGDQIRSFQYYSMGYDPRLTVKKRFQRLGRDWHYRLSCQLERPGRRKGNNLVVHLQLPPDPGEQHHFGPTGFFAKRYPDHLVVDHIDAGSPSEGVLQVGDHIVSVNGEAIDDDVIDQFTRSIDRAEGEDGKGAMRLAIKRPDSEGVLGAEQDAVLQMEVLGDYEPGAALTGKKADAVIHKLADAIVRDKAYGRVYIGLLGLLATGEGRYIEHVGAYLKASSFAQPDVTVPIDGSVQTWHTSYRTLVMCEYFLLTGDDSVLPAIKTHARSIARGQDAAGLWNHRFANPANNNGNLHGRLNGYGALNQTSITQWLAMILAEKCGVADGEVHEAIEKTYAQLRRYVGRGALPYGNHPAQEEIFTNNGTSGSAAVAFALYGDPEAASYFARMSAAGHRDVLTGHTGPFFNTMWSGLGANVAGPHVSTAFQDKLHWLRTISRTWNGRCVSIEARGAEPGDEGIGATGSELLNACLGRRAIWITGKDADRGLWLNQEDARQAVEAWKVDVSSAETLLMALGSPLPPVRLHAAEALAIQELPVEKDILLMLKHGNAYQKVGAVHAIRTLKLSSALDDLIGVMSDEEADLWLRICATRALPALRGGKKHNHTLLTLIVHDRPGDRFQDLDMALGQALVDLQIEPFREKFDRELFYKAVAELLEHPHVYARQAGMSLLRKIPLEDFHQVADLIMKVVKDEDRTHYTSYHYDAQRQTGLEIMYGLGISESIDLSVSTIKEPLGRFGLRRRNRIGLMETFGAEARHIIPQLREVLGADADPIVEKIDSSEQARKMIPFEAAKQIGRQQEP
jgi:hypothetical protein